MAGKFVSEALSEMAYDTECTRGEMLDADPKLRKDYDSLPRHWKDAHSVSLVVRVTGRRRQMLFKPLLSSHRGVPHSCAKREPPMLTLTGIHAILVTYC